MSHVRPGIGTSLELSNVQEGLPESVDGGHDPNGERRKQSAAFRENRCDRPPW